MTSAVGTYLKFETLRTVRNRQAFIFSLGIPALTYLLIAVPNRHVQDFGGVPGLSATEYYMVSLLSFGAMVAVLGSGARIASERTIGWNRQLRVTPLSVRNYFSTKVATSYLMALIAIALLYIIAASFGVRLPASHWIVMTLLVLVALIPFAGLGIGAGHLLNADAAGPAMGGSVSLLAFLGGAWFPITGDGWFVQFCKLLPSWWLVQAGRVGYGGSLNPWGVEGWIVVGSWSIVLAAFAVWAFRRDTRRA